MLSCSAFDAALQQAKMSELLYSEALVVRARALVGKAATTTAREGSGAHWSGYSGRQRLVEVMGRMKGGDGERSQELLEKLLLHAT